MFIEAFQELPEFDFLFIPLLIFGMVFLVFGYYLEHRANSQLMALVGKLIAVMDEALKEAEELEKRVDKLDPEGKKEKKKEPD